MCVYNEYAYKIQEGMDLSKRFQNQANTADMFK